MDHIDSDIGNLRINLERLSYSISSCLSEFNVHMDTVGHILSEYTHDRKMESIGLMAGGVAHDFRNFIHVIAANANLIKDSTSDPVTLRRASQIVEMCFKASDIVENMMDLVRTDEHPKNHIDLNDEVERNVGLLKGAMPKGILLKTNFEAEKPGIAGDAAQVCRIIANLVNNAREALGQDGSISLKTENTVLSEEDCLRHANARPGEFVVLTIADTGPGIAERILPRIYDPFFSTKRGKGNTGFGLAIVYAIVQRHRGWIDVESKEAAGTRFSIYFPLFQGDA
jgi:two-component system, cell cycle sensor histidine kinase and response regulator CckA